MYTTEKTVTLLKTIAIIADLSITLWSLGLGSLHFADAANLTSVSDTLTDSAPSAASNHTIVFTTPTGVVAGESITIDFGANFNTSSIGVEDIDFASTTDYVLTLDGNQAGEEWGVATTASTITLTSVDASLGANATVTIKIGTHATFGSTGDTQISNPAAEGAYDIDITAGASDSGTARVAIISSVQVTAAVDTIFTFTVSGVGADQAVNGATTTGAASTTSIPFGSLTSGNATTTAQDLTVNTNAANGYVVTMQIDQPLQSSTGADIDGFVEGSDTNTPTAWAAPVAVMGSENTYGHWGFTSNDTDTTRDPGDEFGSGEFAAASTTPRVVMSHNGPANGTGTGEGTARVGYKVEISSLQEAGDDYTATLTYIATPTF
jgi:hypothetical protein